MAYSDIRAELKTLILAVAGIGQVYDYRRHSVYWDEFYTRHLKGGIVNNWEITREAISEEIFAVQNAAGNEPYFHLQHEVKIFGHMSVNDGEASERKFQDLISVIVVKIRQNNLLNGKVILPRQLQVPLIEYRMFGGVFAHYCEMTFEAIERVGG